MLAISKFAASSSRLKNKNIGGPAVPPVQTTAGGNPTTNSSSSRLSPAAIRREIRQGQQQRLSHTGWLVGGDGTPAHLVDR